jgi:hypothetical protein
MLSMAYETFPAVEPDMADKGAAKSGAALLLTALKNVGALRLLASDLLRVIVGYSCWRADTLIAGTRVDAIDTDGKVCVATILDVKDVVVEACDLGTLLLAREEKVSTAPKRFCDCAEAEAVSTRFCLVHYVGYSSVNWDEWISTTSGRLAALRTLAWDDCSHGHALCVRIVGTLCNAYVTEGRVDTSWTPGVIALTNTQTGRLCCLTQATFTATPHNVLIQCRTPGCTMQLFGATFWKRSWSNDAGGLQLCRPTFAPGVAVQTT